MSRWIESRGVEREIVLAVHKHPKPISEISNELGKSIQIVSKTIERMKNQDLIIKAKHYSKDARKTEIELNNRRIRVEKLHMFYLTYYILIFVCLGASLIASVVSKNFPFFLGSMVVALPILLLMLYEVYVKEDKVTVEKNPKPRQQKADEAEGKEVDNVDKEVDKG